MNVKLDTKEKFHVITVAEPRLSATMTEQLSGRLLSFLQNDAGAGQEPVRNLVLVLTEVGEIEVAAAEKLVQVQQHFYENGASFVICELQKSVEDFLDEKGLLEMMNVTPTQSEAWDIVQMEEIEREMFGEQGNDL